MYTKMISSHVTNIQDTYHSSNFFEAENETLFFAKKTWRWSNCMKLCGKDWTWEKHLETPLWGRWMNQKGWFLWIFLSGFGSWSWSWSWSMQAMTWEKQWNKASQRYPLMVYGHCCWVLVDDWAKGCVVEHDEEDWSPLLCLSYGGEVWSLWLLLQWRRLWEWKW